MTFDFAFQKTVGVEGGYSNHPNDPGGETMFGITIKVARLYGYQGDMKALPLAVAKQIYRERYWDLIHLDRVDAISRIIANEAFDTAVNMGVSVPIPILQGWLNALNRQGADYPDLKADGLFGAASAAALIAFKAKRGVMAEKVLLLAMNADQAVAYRGIVERKPTSEDFLWGWLLNRVTA